eukprot:2957691-Amphidinium_carterae.1
MGGPVRTKGGYICHRKSGQLYCGSTYFWGTAPSAAGTGGCGGTDGDDGSKGPGGKNGKQTSVTLEPKGVADCYITCVKHCVFHTTIGVFARTHNGQGTSAREQVSTR